MIPHSVIAREVIQDMIEHAAKTPPGCFVEVGVYQGGSAFHLAKLAQFQKRTFYAYDTFEGIPFSEKGVDHHPVGDFKETSFEQVSKAVPYAKCVKGLFPSTFVVPETCVAFAHLDVDQRQSYDEAISALIPYMAEGGIIWFDEPGDKNFKPVTELVKERFGEKIRVAKCGKWFVTL